MSREVTVEEAAKCLGVSRDTIMRRIRKGELEAQQKPRPQGHVWRVTIPDEEPDNQHVEALTRELQTVRDVQAALPAARDQRAWWRFWQR
jgi:excisionase family DNA binding protein